LEKIYRDTEIVESDFIWPDFYWQYSDTGIDKKINIVFSIYKISWFWDWKKKQYWYL